MFGYLQLRVNPLVDVEGSQARAVRIETANQSIPSFTHCMGSWSGLRWCMLREAVRTRHDKHSLTLAMNAAQTQSFTTAAESEMWFDPRTIQPVGSRYTDYATCPTNVIKYVHNCAQQQKNWSHSFKWYELRTRFKDATIRKCHQVKQYVYFVFCFVLTDTYVGLNDYLEYLSSRSTRHVSMFRSVLRLWRFSFHTLCVGKSPD